MKDTIVNMHYHKAVNRNKIVLSISSNDKLIEFLGVMAIIRFQKWMS